LIASDTSCGELQFVLPHEVQSSHFNLNSTFYFVRCHYYIRFPNAFEAGFAQSIEKTFRAQPDFSHFEAVEPPESAKAAGC
jgi:hypothetical protein